MKYIYKKTTWKVLKSLRLTRVRLVYKRTRVRLVYKRTRVWLIHKKTKLTGLVTNLWMLQEKNWPGKKPSEVMISLWFSTPLPGDLDALLSRITWKHSTKNGTPMTRKNFRLLLFLVTKMKMATKLLCKELHGFLFHSVLTNLLSRRSSHVLDTQHLV